MAYMILISFLLGSAMGSHGDFQTENSDAGKFTLIAEWSVSDRVAPFQNVTFYANKTVVFDSNDKSYTMGYRLTQKEPGMITGEFLRDHPYYSSNSRARFKIEVESAKSIRLVVLGSSDAPELTLSLQKIADIEHGAILP